MAKWRVEHSRLVMEKGSKTLFSQRGREGLPGQLAAMRKLAWRLGWPVCRAILSGQFIGVTTHPDRSRLDQLLAWQEKRRALAEAALEALVAPGREPGRVNDLLPQPKRRRRSA